MVIILLLAYFVISIPSLATALMTGTPTSSATEALRLGMPAITAMSTTLTVAYLIGKGGVEGAKETGSGMSKGMDTGGHIGGSIGGAVGGLFGAGGMALGQKLGATVGSATGGMVGGMYSAGKWGAKTAHGKMAGNSNPRSHANWGTDSSSSGANQGTKTDTGSERSTILNGESSKEN